jgi:hypothetical protein
MLENLPESFLLQLADIDPVVGMVSKKLHKSCGGSIIDTWKFVTSRARYIMAISNTVRGGYVFEGIQSVACVKAASGDNEFLFMDHDNIPSLFGAAKSACILDVPRILAPCIAALPLERMCMRKKSSLIWRFADSRGSTRVLSWFLENHPEIMKAAIPFMSGDHTNTVKWCIENLLKSSPAPVNWLMMKVSAVVDKNAESMALLDWVAVPPCHLHDLCALCPACMIRTGRMNFIYFNPVE